MSAAFSRYHTMFLLLVSKGTFRKCDSDICVAPAKLMTASWEDAGRIASLPVRHSTENLFHHFFSGNNTEKGGISKPKSMDIIRPGMLSNTNICP